MLVLAMFVLGVAVTSCSPKGAKHTSQTTRAHKHFWQYHGK